MTVVTVANAPPSAPYYCFEEMQFSCRRFGIEPMVLGWGEKWGGLGSKPRILKKAIESGKIRDKLIIFMDAYDVVLARNPQMWIPELFNKHNADIVWNAERNLFPDLPIRDKFPEVPGGFRFLNSGFCVARTEALLHYLQHIKADEIPDDYKKPDGSMHHINDQEIALLAYAEDPQCVKMALDTKAEMCATLHQVTLSELNFNDEIFLKPTETHPCAFHANGSAKTSGVMQSVLSHLRLR